MKLCLIPTFVTLVLASSCNAPSSASSSPQPAACAAPVVVAAPSAVVAPVAAAAPVSAAAPAAVPAAIATPAAVKPPVVRVGESTVKVKRLVVATGVKDREPLVSEDALPADGSPIYAFAELANPIGDSENVRITFERKGSTERVGEVTLPVPANTSRHRTWAFTRFIRAAGVWEAVLWSENGAELGRTSFEVKPSAGSGV